jgi:hypothetical protein
LPVAVFGISGDVFMWIFIAAAVVGGVLALAAMFFADPSRPLYVAAAALAVVAVLLLLDPQSRAYGAFLLPAAALFAVGGWLKAGASGEESGWEQLRALTPGSRPAVAAEPGRAPDSPDSPDSAARPDRLPQASAPEEGAGATVEAAIAPGDTDAAPESGAVARCPWCSAALPADATTCPECRATMDSESAADNVPIAGLTEVPHELLAYAARSQRKQKVTALLRDALKNDTKEAPPDLGPPSETALLPPSPEVRAEMARIDQEIASTAAENETSESSGEPGPAIAPDPAADVPPAAHGDDAGHAPAEGPAPARPRRSRRPKP